METRFQAPAKLTTTKIFAGHSALRKAVSGANAWILLDEGVPMPGEFAGRGILRLQGGEPCKRWAELEKILTWLAENRAERSQSLVVIGGGAALDLGALAASLYRRGMALTLVPTTLLGMVDATLGGKTAVDAMLGGRLLKNFAGTFYPATNVWISPEFLSTLSQKERVSGAGELFKTLWLKGGKWKSAPLLDYVETGKPSSGLISLVKACLELKSKFVARDPLDEKRVREALNFGHTVGHALESASQLSHGESVLWGMAVETFLLGKRAKTMAAECARVLGELQLELPSEFASLGEAQWISFLGADKKSKAGKIEMSLLLSPGKIVKKKWAAAEIARAIRAFPESFQRAEARLQA